MQTQTKRRPGTPRKRVVPGRGRGPTRSLVKLDVQVKNKQIQKSKGISNLLRLLSNIQQQSSGGTTAPLPESQSNCRVHSLYHWAHIKTLVLGYIECALDQV